MLSARDERSTSKAPSRKIFSVGDFGIFLAQKFLRCLGIQCFLSKLRYTAMFH